MMALHNEKEIEKDEEQQTESKPAFIAWLNRFKIYLSMKTLWQDEF